MCFSDSRCFGEMKNQKIKKIYGGPKKLSSFKNAGKLAFSQPSFNAATSLCTKKFIKPKWKPLKFKIKSYFIQKCCKVRQRRAIEAEKQPNFLNLSFKKGIFQ